MTAICTKVCHRRQLPAITEVLATKRKTPQGLTVHQQLHCPIGGKKIALFMLSVNASTVCCSAPYCGHTHVCYGYCV